MIELLERRLGYNEAAAATRRRLLIEQYPFLTERDLANREVFPDGKRTPRDHPTRATVPLPTPT